MALAVDASVPDLVAAGAGTVTTGLFTPPAGSVLVAYASVGFYPDDVHSAGPLLQDSQGLSWTQIGFGGGSDAQPGDGAVAWWAVTLTATAMTVSLQSTADNNASAKSLQVIPYTGADISGPIGATGTGNALPGVMSATYTSTRDGSWGWASYTDDTSFNGSPGSTPVGDSNTTVYAANTGFIQSAVLQAAATTPSAGTSVTLATTAPSSGTVITWVYLEILPATGSSSSGSAGLVATAVPGASYVALTLTWPGVAYATVSRVAPDGTVVPVRNGEPATLSGGVWTGPDYEAPLDTSVYYTATTVQTSGTVTSTGVTLYSQGEYWLKHPGHPNLNQQVFPALNHVATLTRDVKQGVYNILGRADPIVITSANRYLPTSQILLMTATDAQRRALVALLSDGQTLLFQAPSGDANGDQSGYVAVGKYDEARIGYTITDRLWTLPITYTGRPAGMTLAGQTANGIIPTPGNAGGASSGSGGSGSSGAAGGTWADVVSDYAAWSNTIATKTSWALLVAQVAP